ncbi:helix-turn-helix domain-containing protein [Spirosoma foliorum]|uniref:Helix-turn-helix domain-containing protein n=1 Tax=Spirosoma foliorum TaxID=2710596 RepID=A0A7G5H2P5_9BACT|nr:helix-turn-helix domain-containing protein [Spirosoma foliorum]QMW05387.1 helix-turn-helix domain-containing protein [Spirosoma foliorum]
MNDFSGIWLPATVLGLTGLNLSEKVVLSQVIMLSRDGECRAKNDYLSRQTGVTVTTISTTLTRLQKKGYIHIEDGKEQGNKRQMYPSLKSLNTLFKNLKEGDVASLKIFKTLYKNFKEALKEIERPYLNILYSLFQNFKELIYRIDNKEENKEENKTEKVFKEKKGAKALFWSVLKLTDGIYKNKATYEAFIKAEKKKNPNPQFRAAPFPFRLEPSHV